MLFFLPVEQTDDGLPAFQWFERDATGSVGVPEIEITIIPGECNLTKVKLDSAWFI